MTKDLHSNGLLPRIPSRLGICLLTTFRPTQGVPAKGLVVEWAAPMGPCVEPMCMRALLIAWQLPKETSHGGEASKLL